MIRHVVLFQFRADFPPDQRAAWEAGLDRMRGNVPGMISLTHGPDVVGAERSFDYAIVADFEDLSDLEVYNTHPLHEPLKAYSFPNSKTIYAVDFEVEQPTTGDTHD